MVVCDIWGGEQSEDHVARYILDTRDALNLARNELAAGYLVNLRNEVAWGGFVNFDKRMARW